MCLLFLEFFRLSLFVKTEAADPVQGEAKPKEKKKSKSKTSSSKKRKLPAGEAQEAPKKATVAKRRRKGKFVF